MTVVTVGQVYAHLGCSLHLGTVHCLTGLRNIDLVMDLHSGSLLWLKASERDAFRKASFTAHANNNPVSFRINKKKLEKQEGRGFWITFAYCVFLPFTRGKFVAIVPNMNGI